MSQSQPTAGTKKMDHSWQTVKKRKRSCISPEIIENPSTSTQNRFQYLNNDSNDMNTAETSEGISKPPPIFIHGVTNYYEMNKILSSAIANEQYYSKTLSNNIVKINVNVPETYRSLVRFLKEQDRIELIELLSDIYIPPYPLMKSNRKLKKQATKLEIL